MTGRFGFAKAVALTSIVVWAAMSGFADDGAMNEGAYGPEPVGGMNGPESVIAMTSEQIDVGFGKKETLVSAKFVFRSTKKESPARQLVGFPDIGAAVKEAARRDPKGEASYHPEGDIAGALKNLRTFVDGKEVKSELKYGYVSSMGEQPWKPGTPKDGTLMAWHVVTLDFPPDKDVVVERRYMAPNGGQIVAEPENSMAWFFQYIVSTGGTWKGPIGKMTVNVTLKDGLTADDIGWPKHKEDFSNLTRPPKEQWEILSPTKMRLVWKDFEPRTEASKRSFTIAAKPTKNPVE